ncbi:Thiamine biosynthesis lipoprotein ApbE precursor [Planctomycetes bacterium Pan216]|uniref:FAD:protein FMN transferase n=1 Tax=Kolteria novifilia TaxID=2527975 RepID=A0A518AX95_9BACT|nr:Thiamine biosynthesis lipoprotein ApbE precursor [Planctomycetes bacterium Pan216]
MKDPTRRISRRLEPSRERVEDLLEEVEAFANEPVVTCRRQAMACAFDLQFAKSANHRVALTSLEMIDDLEAQMTVYQDDSELSEINAKAAETPVVVEERLFELLARCRALSLQTGGAFDITSGPLIKAWGFYRREGHLPTPDELREARARVGIDKVRFDPRAKTVRFTKPGIELNLGAIGKGYALDRVGEYLREQEFGAALLSAGHSSLLALGRPSWDVAWHVDLRDPRDLHRQLAMVRLRDQALSTSSASQQYFDVDGKRYGHLIDPRTGWPTEGVLQVTVAAPDATLAEGLSTAFFIHGWEWTASYVKRHPELGVLMVLQEDPAKPARVEVTGTIDVDMADA